MALYMIGIGLCDEKDITIKGLELIKKSSRVYLESYTSILQCSTSDLEEFYGKKIIRAQRDLVESQEDILSRAQKEDIALLIIGDVFSATTHISLYGEAVRRKIRTEVVHNASVLTAVGATGLSLYKFGRTASIPEQKGIITPYNVLEENKKLHTLFLLDLQPMTVKRGIEIMFEIEKEQQNGIFTKDTKIVACARLGCPDQKMVYSSADEILGMDLGKPPHCFIVPGELHFVEEDMLKLWRSQ